MAVCAVIREVESEYTVGKRSSSRKFVVRGPTTRVAAESEVVANTPAYDGTMVRKGWQLRQTSLTTWEATVNYSTELKLNVGETTTSGTTKGGSTTITHGLEHIVSTTASGTHPGHSGAINVTDEEVEGVEIKLPVFSFSVTKAFTPGTVTNAYMSTLASATTKVNNGAWYGFAKGEVLFAGVDWDIDLEKETLTYDFEVSRNLPTLTVAGITVPPIAGVAKEGWHYLWVETKKGSDVATGHATEKTVAVHIDRVYDYFNFALLGI